MSSHTRAYQVELVLQQLLVVCAAVNCDWQAVLGMEACSGCIEADLPDWDPHTIGSQISQSQDSPTICDDYDLYSVGEPIVQDFADPAAVVECIQVHAQC